MVVQALSLAEGFYLYSLYSRGNPRDYDHWHGLGNVGWSFAEVLPYFKKAENQERGVSEHHGVVFFPAFILLIVASFAMAWVFWRRAPAVVLIERGALAN